MTGLSRPLRSVFSQLLAWAGRIGSPSQFYTFMGNAGLTVLLHFWEPLFFHLCDGNNTTIYLLVKGDMQQAMHGRSDWHVAKVQ